MAMRPKGLTMKYLTVGDLKLGLRDMMDNHAAELHLSGTGKLYAPRLQAKREEIDALPDLADKATPLASELGQADVRHDALGGAFYWFVEAIKSQPDLPQAMKSAAEQARATMLPGLSHLRRSYADEAAAAQSNRKELERQKAALKAIPTPEAGNLYTWVKAFVDSGDAIDTLLQKRATLIAPVDSAQNTAPLRSASIGLLSRFRDALEDEASEGNLPAKHVATLFAYLDKLNADRIELDRARAKRNAAAEPKVEPAEDLPTGEPPKADE